MDALLPAAPRLRRRGHGLRIAASPLTRVRKEIPDPTDAEFAKWDAAGRWKGGDLYFDQADYDFKWSFLPATNIPRPIVFQPPRHIQPVFAAGFR
jgi:hypothetical protein